MFSRFLDILFPPRENEYAVRALSSDIVLSLMEPVLVSKTRPATTALLPFHHPQIRALIHEAKYRENKRARALLAEVLREYLNDPDIDAGYTDVRLIPIPLGIERLQERGYNQATEIAIEALKGTDVITLNNLLVRTRETPSQVSLQKNARIENMLGAFSTNQEISSAPLYILLDDVTTTGSTMQAGIDGLMLGGAKHILPIALAH